MSKQIVSDVEQVAAAAKTIAEKMPQSEREKLLFMLKGMAFAAEAAEPTQEVEKAAG